MSAAHTPGPWQLATREREETFEGLTFKRRSIYGTQSAVLIADVCGPEIRCEMHAHAEFEANARLIAAAPELLAALVEMTDLADKLGEIAERAGAINRAYLDEQIAQARSALAKAEAHT
jgi:hypothetical protein